MPMIGVRSGSGALLVALVALVPTAGAAAVASAAPTCSVPALDASASGWVSMDPEASVERSRAEGLTFGYHVRSSAMSVLARADVDLRGCESLSFRVRSSHSGGLAFGVSEPDESRYVSVTRVDAGRATEVRLNLDELQLAEDSTDEDGRLEPGTGMSLFFLDVAVFGQNLDPGVRGERTLWLGGITFSAERTSEESRRPGKEAGTLILDTFETGLVRWMPVTASFEPPRFALYPEGVELALVPAPAPEQGKVLEARHTHQPMSAFGLMRDVAGLDLTRAERIVLRARTERPATFLVAVEERAGARYEQIFELGAERWQQVEVPLDGLRLADDSRDANGRLDLDSLKLVSIVAARLDRGAAVANTLYLDDPGFVVRAAEGVAEKQKRSRSRRRPRAPQSARAILIVNRSQRTRS